jgi:CMP/dCMP kinase
VGQKKINIALDGHSSCGKSTYAKLIAAELGYAYIDSGAMYRAVTLAAMDAGLFEKTEAPAHEKIEDLLDKIELRLSHNPEKKRTELFLNNRMVEDLIRSMEVSAHVSYIAAISAVRRKMVEYQRMLGREKGVVMDGRDIGTVVFPDAELKIFLTASLEVRAGRRYRELIEKGMSADFKAVRQNLEKRDYIDSNRDDSPLKQADDAILLDNSEISLEEQMVWFKNLYQQVISGGDDKD